jgi:minor extracellular serine protease Vpr
MFTPVGGSNNGVTLRVPYYMVPQGASNVSTRIDSRQLRKTGSTTATTTNPSLVAGSADWYAWGINDSRDRPLGSNDIRAVGASSPGGGVIQFGISTGHRWSNATQNEFDVFVDVNGDGNADYDVVAADLGALTTGSFDGRDVTVVFNLRTGGGTIDFVTDAPTDSNTIVLPADLSLLTEAGHPATSLDGTVNKRITYWVTGFGLTDNTSDTTSTAVFNPFTPAVSTGMFDALAPGGSATEALTTDPTELLQSPALGWLVISHENRSGRDEAQQISLR